MKHIFWTSILLLVVSIHIKSCLSAPQGGNPFLGLRTSSDNQKKQRKPRPPLMDKPNLVEEEGEEDKEDKTESKTNTDRRNDKPLTEFGGGVKSVKSRRGCSAMCRMCKEMYNLSEKEYEEAKDSQRFCVRLRQVQRCFRRLRREQTPSFMIFMFFTTGVRIQTNKHGCDKRNVTADDLQNIFEDFKKKAEADKENDEVSIGRSCRYREKNTTVSQLAHCGLFGDPHLKTFFGVRQTCVVEGEWVLVDNEYMKVQVTNEMVQNLEVPRATATKKVRCFFLYFFI